MSRRSTLVKPPPPHPFHSPIESVLSLLPLADIGPDVFTNAHPIWQPAVSRGVFGGAVIAQCLVAAQATIPDNFTVHSMHCYFVLGGDHDVPILYHVERVREGKSFITRTVQARQRGRCIFTTTMSFVREGSGGKERVEHVVQMPTNVLTPPDRLEPIPGLPSPVGKTTDGIAATETPFESVRCPIEQDGPPEKKKVRHWIRARGRLSDVPVPSPHARQDAAQAGEKKDNHQSHLSALAYMTDFYFIGTVSRVHNLHRFSLWRRVEMTVELFKEIEKEKQMKEYLERVAQDDVEESTEPTKAPPKVVDGKAKRRIGMMVSLDHTIYFHNPRAFRADEWLLTEIESPWAEDGRALVMQRIWTKDGTLVATCVQEGVVRLAEPGKQARM